MNNDLISREALKKYKFTTQIANGVELEDIEVVPLCVIDNAPPVESDKELYEKIETYKNAYRIMSDAFENEVRKNRPTGEWIPVSERLPEKSGEYLVTVDYGNDIGRMCQHRHFFSKGIGFEDEYITAWMPLPEPYKEAENE